MTAAQRRQVEEYLQIHAADFIDRWGEIDATRAVETVADLFDIYVDEVDYEIPDDLWEDVPKIIERHTGTP